MRNIANKIFIKTQNTQFKLSNFSSKITPFSDNVEKYFRAEQATDGNMAHARCTLDT